MISLLLTLILGFASDSCNNKDIILILGYNYNLAMEANYINDHPLGRNLISVLVLTSLTLRITLIPANLVLI